MKIDTHNILGDRFSSIFQKLTGDKNNRIKNNSRARLFGSNQLSHRNSH